MLIKTYSSAVHGVDAQTITVEVNAGGNVGAGKRVQVPGYVQVYRYPEILHADHLIVEHQLPSVISQLTPVQVFQRVKS